MSTVSENIKRIREKIDEAAQATGRSGEDITLVAASKTKPPELIRQAIEADIDAIGENRVQEMEEKRMQHAYDGTSLHFIGHLQSNKVNKLVGVCDLIETVSSTKLIELIGRRAASLGTRQKVLIEVNVGREPQKSGALPEQLEEILETAARTDGINVLGLMSVPPFDADLVKNCNYFDIMYKLFVDISVKKYDNVSVQLLSMGMSDSYADAIRAGSNMVRIGSAIFGER